MPTYKQVIECVRNQTGRTVKTCWVAEVKREMGVNDTKGLESRTRSGGPAMSNSLQGRDSQMSFLNPARHVTQAEQLPGAIYCDQRPIS